MWKVVLLHSIVLPSLVEGHAYMTYPEMRGGATGNMANGYCPQCLGAVDLPQTSCGNDKFLNWDAGPITMLEAGEKVQFEIRVTAHHKGHFRFRLCDQAISSAMGGHEAEERCLNEHVLKRVRPTEMHSDCAANDMRGDCQPYDYANPGYWYLPPPGLGSTVQIAGANFKDTDAVTTEQTDFTNVPSLLQVNSSRRGKMADLSRRAGIIYKFHYWIPQGFACERCTLQWWWLSANSCTPHPDAYKCYFQKMKAAGWDADDWCPGVCSFRGECPAVQGPTVSCGEQFKNCADVKVVDKGGKGGGPAPPGPRPAPGTAPTPRPVATPAPPVFPSPTPAPPAPPAGKCSDLAMTGGWVHYKCSKIAEYGVAYCAHREVKTACCFCGGGQVGGGAGTSQPTAQPTGGPAPTAAPVAPPTAEPEPEPEPETSKCKDLATSGTSLTCAGATASTCASYPELKEACCACGGGCRGSDHAGTSQPTAQPTGGPAPTWPPVSLPTAEPEPEPEPETLAPTAMPTPSVGPLPCTGAGSCKEMCLAACAGAWVQINQCWGTPRFVQCECKDGSSHTFSGCECEHSTCPDVATPTPVSPSTETPSPAPSPEPTETSVSPSPAGVLKDVLAALMGADSAGVFMYDTGTGWVESDIYTWPDMVKAVEKMATTGVGSLKLWLGEDTASADAYKYGLVNVAAFLAQCMQETIQYNACDENNWSDKAVVAEAGGSSYSSTSACGQLHQSYQDYKCSAEEEAVADGGMACPVDPDMELRAHTQAGWYGAPPKLFCAPKSKVPKAPRWDYSAPWCPPKGGWGYEPPIADDAPLEDYFEYVNVGGSCKDYDGIKTGGWKFAGEGCSGGACPGSPAPLFGQPEGRTDLEGCCWWGRGVIQTTGVCNFGKLNYYIGKRAADDGKTSLYPTIDFCKNPGIICAPEGPRELKWVAGFFYWLNAVQTYSSGGWSYLDELKKWVDGGMDASSTGFINGASGIVNRGCHNPPNCGTGELHAGPQRVNNFMKVLAAMGLKRPLSLKQHNSGSNAQAKVSAAALVQESHALGDKLAPETLEEDPEAAEVEL